MASQGTRPRFAALARIVGITVLLGSVMYGCASQPAPMKPPADGGGGVILEAVPVSIDIREPQVPGGTDITVDLSLGAPAPAAGQLVHLYYNPIADSDGVTVTAP